MFNAQWIITLGFLAWSVLGGWLAIALIEENVPVNSFRLAWLVSFLLGPCVWLYITGVIVYRLVVPSSFELYRWVRCVGRKVGVR